VAIVLELPSGSFGMSVTRGRIEIWRDVFLPKRQLTL
jgi:hypothetical protein